MDTDKDYKIIAAFDGGGAKASFYLHMIQAFENHTGRKLVEVCDLFVGVSAGAMMAAALASEKEIKTSELEQTMHTTMSNPQNMLVETKYDGIGKRNMLEQLWSKNELMVSCPHPLVVLAATMQGEPEVFTSWDNRADSLTIAQVLDASTAAPVYFPPVELNHTWYIDGGVSHNDPSLIGLAKARARWGDQFHYAILSFGAGYTPPIAIEPRLPREFGLLRWLQSGLLNIVMRADQAQSRDIATLLLGKGNYVRLCSTVAASLDDTSSNTQTLLASDAAQIWAAYQSPLLEWFRRKKRTFPQLDGVFASDGQKQSRVAGGADVESASLP